MLAFDELRADIEDLQRSPELVSLENRVLQGTRGETVTNQFEPADAAPETRFEVVYCLPAVSVDDGIEGAECLFTARPHIRNDGTVRLQANDGKMTMNLDSLGEEPAEHGRR